MPIYAYRCSACGHAEDTLQKMSDAPLTVCPSCGQAAYSKQVTAAGFQLKGSGWYVTDFRNNNSGGGNASAAAKPAGESASAEAKPAADAAPTPAPAAAPATVPAATPATPSAT